jgi:FHA domain
MTATCPNGHLSTQTDYCDQCGARLTDPAPQAGRGPDIPSRPPPTQHATDPEEVPPITTPSVPAEPCPDCSAPRIGSDKFCEGCGYNFAIRQSSGSSAPSPSPPPPTRQWEILVSADRDYFDGVATDEIDYPSHCRPRSFALDKPQMGIGRHNPSRGAPPEIDLSGAPEDPAISHLHAILIRQDDGSYALLDPGSSNGTTLNEDPTPIATNTAVPLTDGDRIHLGAWTTITVRDQTNKSAGDDT